MDEIRRLNYLDALGLQQWVPLAPLVNAKPSVFVQALEAIEPSESADSSVPSSDAANPASVNETHTYVEPVQQNNIAADGSSTAASVPDPDGVEPASLPKTSEAEESLATSISLEIYGRKGSYALSIENEQAKSLSQSKTTLLNNILKAVDKLASGALDGTDMQTQNSFREAFTWPMFENTAEPKTITGRQAMIDALNAFISASIKRHQQKHLIVLGKNLEHFLDQQFFGEPINIIFLPDLDEMTSKPEYKAEAWHKLLQVFKS